MSKIFTCFCNQQIQLALPKLKEHIKSCQTYQRESPFTREFNKLPIQRLLPVHLLAIKAEFMNYLDTLEEQLQQRNRVEQGQPAENHLKLAQSTVIARNLIDAQAFGSQQVQCYKCGTLLDKRLDTQKLHFLQGCLHPFCKSCLSKQIQDEYVPKEGEIRCLCGIRIQENEMELIIGKNRKELLAEKLIEKQFNITMCTKCGQKFAFESGNNKDINLKDPITQKPLPRNLVQHYVENRFVCLNNGCKQEQCKECHSTPYHLGMTCKDFQFKKNQKNCRFCGETASANADVCKNPECHEKLRFSCTKTLRCRHACNGFKGEQQCLPCLHPDCQANMENDQKAEDYCNICFVEGLGQAPCIQAICGHIFHYQCLIKNLNMKWNGPRINFNFCLCALCKQWMQFEQGSEPQTQMQNYQALLEEVNQKSLERLKYEGRDKDQRLMNPQDNYYQKPKEYALSIYSYYQCYKCRKPYFGGGRDCQRAMDDDNKPFKPEELVCGNCCEMEPGDVCKLHGKEFIDYKCKYCCSVAVWFCWGNTHFCDSCHKRQCNGDYVSKYPREKLPKCPGNDQCPLKIVHKPNGDECAMGCTLCQNLRHNVQAF